MEDLFSETQATASDSAVDDIAVEAVAEGEVVATKKQKKPINQQKLQDNIWGWAFCAPLIIGTAFFVFFSFIVAVVLSFSQYNTYSGTLFKFLGDIDWARDDLNNLSPFYYYMKMFSAGGGDGTAIIKGDLEATWKTLFNTVFYMIGIPIGMILSMVLAVLMSRDIKGGNVFRIIYYIPCVTSTVAVTYTFQTLFQNNGVINQLFHSTTQWLYPSSAATDMTGGYYWTGGLIAKCVVIIMSVWKGLGGTIILFCAGLSGVNAATKEAASIDGANGWQIFWKVTMPDLSPTIFYTIVTSVIGGMQIYTEPQLLFAATYVNYYTDGFVAMIYYNGISASAGVAFYAYGCALGMLLFVIILILTLIQFKLQKQD